MDSFVLQRTLIPGAHLPCLPGLTLVAPSVNAMQCELNRAGPARFAQPCRHGLRAYSGFHASTVDFSSVRTSRIEYSVWCLTRCVTLVVIHPFLHVWTVVGRGYALRGQRTALTRHASKSLCSNGTEIDCSKIVKREPYIIC